MLIYILCCQWLFLLWKHWYLPQMSRQKQCTFLKIYLPVEANRWHCKNSTLKNITICMEYYRCLRYEKPTHTVEDKLPKCIYELVSHSFHNTQQYVDLAPHSSYGSSCEFSPWNPTGPPYTGCSLLRPKGKAGQFKGPGERLCLSCLCLPKVALTYAAFISLPFLFLTSTSPFFLVTILNRNLFN